MALPLPWRSSTYIAKNRRIRVVGIASVFALVLLSAATIAPLTKKTEYTEAATGTASETTLTIATTDYPTLDLSVNNLGGTFTETAAGSGQGSFSVTTTNYTGYTLSISASDNNGTLVNSSDSTTSIASIGSATGESAVPTTGIPASTFNTTAYNGMWGYKPSMLNSEANTNYLSAPTTTATTIDETSVPNTTANTYTIDLAARLQYTQNSGTYSKTFILTAVGNQIDYQISYDGTGADSGTTPETKNDDTNLTYIILSSTAPTKEGYTFKGWCTVSTGTDGTGACTGTVYQPGDQYPINQTTQNLATLYAMWKKDIIAMQDMPDSQCTTDAQTIATDTRDDKTYTVQRLADGKCWMTSNLNLAGSTALYSDDSNVAPANTRASGTPYYTLPASVSGTGSNDFKSDTAAYVSNKTNTTCGSNNPCYSYYSWLAATAGGKDAYGNAVAGNGYNTAYSICPKGWRLPTATTSNANVTDNNNWKTGDFYALATAYGADLESYPVQGSNTFYDNVNGGNAAGKAPVYLLLAGYYNSGSFYDGGKYWSATSSSYGSFAYNLYFTSSNYIAVGNHVYRNYGLAVRCVKMGDFENNDPLGMLEAGNATMQDIGELSSAGLVALMNGMTDGRQYSVKDVRDNKIYTITKINGALWMTQNLAYIGDIGSTYDSSTGGGTMIMKSATSNITSDATVTYYSLKSGESSYTNHCNSSNGYDYPCAKEGTDDEGGITVWYNYAAATANTIKGSSTTTDASVDICPKGWKLPVSGTASGGFGSVTPYKDTFSPVYGGNYNNGSLYSASTYGGWWSMGANNGTSRYILYYDSDSLNVSGYYIDHYRYRGYYVRCVRTS